MANVNILKLDESLYDLPFDQFSRQFRVLQMVRFLSNEKKGLKILDVGGYKGKTSEFHKTDDVYVVDLFKDKTLKNYTQTDGKKIPFSDGEFDFVVSFDTYEHVPRPMRRKFISEMLRVSKNGVILAAPFDDSEGNVSSAEKALNEYNKKLYGKEHRWLKEHIDYKIPDHSVFEDSLKANGIFQISLKSNDLMIWALMQTLLFSIDLDDEFRGRVDDLNRFYNRNVDLVDSTEEEVSYRRIYFLTRDKKMVKMASDFTKLIHTQISYKKKLQFVTFLMDTFGVKYRDIILYRNYLESELARHKEIVSNHQKGLGAVYRRIRSLLPQKH